MDRLKFIVPGKPEYLTMVRLAISSIAATAGFDLEAVEDMKTSVSEACKNISCHGYAGFSDQYEVECKVDQDLIRIAVKDGCDVHTLEKTSGPCHNCPSEGNLGIYVIKTLMSEVNIGTAPDGRKQITMIKRK